MKETKNMINKNMVIKRKAYYQKVLQAVLVLLCMFIFSVACITTNADEMEAPLDSPEFSGLMLPAIEGVSEQGNFSVVPVDNNTISIMHISQKGTWAGVPLKLPEEIIKYNLFIYKNMLFLTGGYLKKLAVLNKKMYKVDIFDGNDNFIWQEIGEAPAMAANINMRFSTENINLDLFIDDKYLKEYRAKTDESFNIISWQ
ncbi:MAG: hypothetical protein ABIH39_03105 [Candidatus Margulisiibacteriota bacterium]